MSDPRRPTHTGAQVAATSTAAMTAADGGGEAKRAKLRKSCRRCFAGKVKCVGENPCQRCAAHGWECIATDAEAKRGRPRVEVRRTSHDEPTVPPVTAPRPAPNQPHHQRLPRLAEVATALAAPPSASGHYWSLRQSWTAPPAAAPRLPGLDLLASVDQGTASVERRLLRVFFALFKHHRNGASACSRRWFSLQVNKLWTEWRARGVVTDEVKRRFMRWADANDLAVLEAPPPPPPPRGATDVVPRVLGALAPKLIGVGTPASVHLAACASPIDSAATKSGSACPTRPPLDPSYGPLPYLRVFSTHEGTLFEMSRDFESLTRVSKTRLNGLFMWTLDGFLPWGADALALLVDSDDAVLSYIVQCAPRFNALEWPTSFPASRKVRLPFTTRFAPPNGAALSVKLWVTVIETLAAERTSVDVTFELCECAPLASPGACVAGCETWTSCAQGGCGHAPRQRDCEAGDGALDWIDVAPVVLDEATISFLESL